MTTNFYTIELTDKAGIIHQSQTFATISAARRFANHCAKFSIVRIMKGGIGGMEVK